MTRFTYAAPLLSFLLATTIVVSTAACEPNDKVLFKCSQTCAGGSPTALPDICESSNKSPEELAKNGQQTLADAGLQGCTLSCQKTDTPCTQK